jgi:hypothetical protein
MTDKNFLGILKVLVKLSEIPPTTLDIIFERVKKKKIYSKKKNF